MPTQDHVVPTQDHVVPTWDHLATVVAVVMVYNNNLLAEMQTILVYVLQVLKHSRFV